MKTFRLKTLVLILFSLVFVGTMGCRGESNDLSRVKKTEVGHPMEEPKDKPPFSENIQKPGSIEGKTFQLIGHWAISGAPPSIYLCLTYSSTPGRCTIYYGTGASSSARPIGKITGATCKIVPHPSAMKDHHVLTCSRSDGTSCDPDGYFDNLPTQGTFQLPTHSLHPFSTDLDSGIFLPRNDGRTYVKIVQNCES